MPDSNQTAANERPDLEESTNVAVSHGMVLRDISATRREKRIREDGMEPISLWIVLGSSFVLMIAGGVLGSGGDLFDYGELRTDGYVRAGAPGGGDDVKLTAPILTALSKNGAKVYSKCNGCHQSSGMGDGAQYPPLGGSEWVQGDTETLAMIILNGLKGEITVSGKTWNQAAMTAQGPMNALELASVMTYVRNSFGNETGDVVTTEMAAAAIEISKERAGGAPIGDQMTVAELKENHARMLPGETVDPATVVDLETLEPVGDPEAAN